MRTFTDQDRQYMHEAIKLARLAWGRTSPDPLVGAVIVKNGKVVGRGYHAELATPHAESFALREAGTKARGATLYVNLEPCSHYGNNPPCEMAIRKAGIKRVVASMKDPNPLVVGKGFRSLRKARIRVDIGLMEGEARRLNEAFIKFITTGKPFVTLKSAMSLDGKIATRTGESRWITGKEARQYAHLLRAGSGAVMVGIGTVLADDPELTARDPLNVWQTVPEKSRLPKIQQPLRVVIDPMAKMPISAKLVRKNPERTLIVVGSRAPRNRVKRMEAKGVQVFVAKTNRGEIQLPSVLKELASRGIMSVLIEGGGSLNAHALFQKIVDKVIFFVSPKIIGGEGAITPVEGGGIESLSRAINLHELRIERVDNDILIEGYVIR